MLALMTMTMTITRKHRGCDGDSPRAVALFELRGQRVSKQSEAMRFYFATCDSGVAAEVSMRHT